MFDYYSLIDQYLEGALSGEQLIKFEKQLLIDKELASIVDGHNLYSSVADGLIEDQIRQNIHSVEKKNKKTIQIRFLLLALASLFILSMFFHFVKKESSCINQFEEFYFVPKSLASRGAQTNAQDVQDACIEAHIFLDINEVDKSKNLFQKLIKTDPNACNGKANYFLAYIAVKETDSADAIHHLEQVVELSNDNELKEKASQFKDAIKTLAK